MVKRNNEKPDMEPKMLILMHYMELGGAESALLGLEKYKPSSNDKF